MMNKKQFLNMSAATWLGIASLAALAAMMYYHFWTHPGCGLRPLHVSFLLLAVLLVAFTQLSHYSQRAEHILIRYSWFFILLILVAPWLVSDYVFFHEVSFDTHPLTKLVIDYCAIIASTLSIIFVIYTLVLQRRQLEDSNRVTCQMRDNEVMKIVDGFLSPEMLKCRDMASALRDELRYDKEATRKKLSYAFERQIRDDCYKNPDWPRFRESRDYAEYAAYIRMMRFFDMISYCPLSDGTVRSVHHYYVWWRSFLMEGLDVYDEVWNRTPPEERQLSFRPGWTTMCERMDGILRSFGLPVA